MKIRLGSCLGFASTRVKSVVAGSAMFLAFVAVLSPAAAFAQTLNSSTTTISSSVNPSSLAQPIVFSASVTGLGNNSVPTGTVTFIDSGTAIGMRMLDSTGVTSFATASLSEGLHFITATYSGDSNYAASSTSTAITQLVKAPLAVAAIAVASSMSPAPDGQWLILTATLTGPGGAPNPTGKVNFLDGTVSLGSASLNGSDVATLSIRTLAPGPHLITIQYGGNTFYSSSTSGVLTQIINNPSAPDTNGYIYFVHGADGRDLSPNYNPALPLDVSLDGTCVIKNWSFADVRGPYVFPAGVYYVQVTLANALSPCNGTVIYTVFMPVLQGQSSFAAAAISPSHSFTGYLFTPDISPIDPNVSPYISHRGLLANASTEDITVNFTLPPYLEPTIFVFAPVGGAGDLPVIPYSGVLVVGGLGLTFQGAYDPEDVVIYIAVGSIDSGSFQLITVPIHDVS
jgi:hypothetical protein